MLVGYARVSKADGFHTVELHCALFSCSRARIVLSASPLSASAVQRGVTWLNMLSDRLSAWRAGSSQARPRDSLHALDVAFSLDHGQRPDILAVQGDYSFMLPALDGRLRELRDGRRRAATAGQRSHRNANAGLPAVFCQSALT